MKSVMRHMAGIDIGEVRHSLPPSLTNMSGYGGIAELSPPTIHPPSLRLSISQYQYILLARLIY